MTRNRKNENEICTLYNMLTGEGERGRRSKSKRRRENPFICKTLNTLWCQLTIPWSAFVFIRCVYEKKHCIFLSKCSWEKCKQPASGVDSVQPENSGKFLFPGWNNAALLLGNTLTIGLIKKRRKLLVHWDRPGCLLLVAVSVLQILIKGAVLRELQDFFICFFTVFLKTKKCRPPFLVHINGGIYIYAYT